LIPAVRISHLTGLPLTEKPNSYHTAIIDDCIDSGATYKKYEGHRWYYVLIDKKSANMNEWIEFWWEKIKR